MGIQCLWKSWAQGAFSSNFPKLLPQSSPFWQLLHIVLEEQHLAFSVEGAQAMKLSKKAKKKPRCTLEIQVPGLLEPILRDSVLLPGLVPWLRMSAAPHTPSQDPNPPGLAP